MTSLKFACRAILVSSVLSALCMASLVHSRVSVELPFRKLEARNIIFHSGITTFKVGDVVATATLNPRAFARLPEDIVISFYGYKVSISSKITLFDASFISYPHEMNWTPGFGFCIRNESGEWDYITVGPFSDYRRSSSGEDNKLNAFKGIVCLIDSKKTSIFDQARIVAKSNGREVGPVAITPIQYKLENQPDLSPAFFEMSVSKITLDQINIRTCFKSGGKCRSHFDFGLMVNDRYINYSDGCSLKLSGKNKKIFNFLGGRISIDSIDTGSQTFEASFTEADRDFEVYFDEIVLIYDFRPIGGLPCGSAST